MQKSVEAGNNFTVDDWYNRREISNKKVIFIFACPWKKEFVNNKPCAGQTGNNLDSLIEKLKETHLLSGWVFIFGHSPSLLVRAPRAHMSTCQSLRLFLATRKRILWVINAQLHIFLIFLQLVFLCTP